MAQEDEVGALRKICQDLQADNAKLKDELKRYRQAFDALKRLIEGRVHPDLDVGERLVGASEDALKDACRVDFGETGFAEHRQNRFGVDRDESGCHG
jgi:hypothetical protein